MYRAHSHSRQRSIGVALLVVFFAFGCCAAGLTVFLLLFPGTPIDAVWRLNPRAREGLAHMGPRAALLMTMVSAACGVASIGLWRGAAWGLWTAVAVLAVNVTGDAINALVAHDYRTLIGLPIGGLMLAYLLRQRHKFINGEHRSIIDTERHPD